MGSSLLPRLGWGTWQRLPNCNEQVATCPAGKDDSLLLILMLKLATLLLVLIMNHCLFCASFERMRLVMVMVRSDAIADSKMQLWSRESEGSIFNTLWFEFAAETGFRLNRSRFSLHGPLSSWIHQCAALSWSFKAPHTSAIPKSTVQERILARKLYNILIFGLQCTAMHSGAMQCNEL